MRVKHPTVPGFVKSVELGRLDEWLAAGWLLDEPTPEPVVAPEGC